LRGDALTRARLGKHNSGEGMRRSAKGVLMENALVLYSKGELSLEQASILAEVSPWELITMMVERGMNHRGTADELSNDAKLRLEEQGFARLAGML